jgi:lipid-A-disaccharide synthase
MTKDFLKIMIVAGETSGDLHAAKLVAALRETEPEMSCVFFGAAGRHMRDAGVEPIVAADELSIVGLLEIGRALPMFIKAFRRLKRSALERRPDVVILVDFPDFNLKLARSLSKQGCKIVYYISPQLWAWRRYRVRSIRKYVDLVISILPFEMGWYAEQGIEHVEYVGSPLAREVQPTVSKDEFCRKYKLDPDKPIVSLLPGSRRKEVTRILPVMIDAASRMHAVDSRIQFVIAAASETHLTDIAAAVQNGATGSLPENLITVCDDTFNALKASDAAAVASGTATLETGIIGTPMAIVYKTSALNYRLLRPLIDVDHFGLINLIAEERIATELIQDEFTGESLAAELFRILVPDENARVRKRLQVATDKLGHGGASRRAAEAILKLVGG